MTAVDTVPARCLACGAELGPALLACPACARLVHGARARALAGEGAAAEQRGDSIAALAAWRAARELLPVGTSQHNWMTSKVQALSRTVEAPGPHITTHRGRAGWTGLFGALGLLVWKLKFVLTFLAANGKFLLLGVAKGSALVPALLSFAAFGTGFGWRIAGGLLLSLYIHELGHVAWCVRYGIPVTPPMFVPGVGAFVRLRHRPVDAHEDARIGLAGPAWGLGAAIAALLGALALSWPAARSVAWWGALINLLNLVPFGSLDGGRAFGALARGQRIVVAGVLALAWVVGGGWPCALLAALAGARVRDATAPASGDRVVLIQYLLLATVLAAVVAVSAIGATAPPPAA